MLPWLPTCIWWHISHYGQKISWTFSDEIINIFGKTPFPLTLGGVEGLIVLCIGVKYDISNFIDNIYRRQCFYSSIPYHLDLPIVFWYLPVFGDVVKCPHLISNLIPRVEDDDKVGVVHQLRTTTEIFQKNYVLLQELLYLSSFMGVVVVLYKFVA